VISQVFENPRDDIYVVLSGMSYKTVILSQ